MLFYSEFEDVSLNNILGDINSIQHIINIQIREFIQPESPGRSRYCPTKPKGDPRRRSIIKSTSSCQLSLLPLFGNVAEILGIEGSLECHTASIGGVGNEVAHRVLIQSDVCLFQLAAHSSRLYFMISWSIITNRKNYVYSYMCFPY